MSRTAPGPILILHVLIFVAIMGWSQPGYAGASASAWLEMSPPVRDHRTSSAIYDGARRRMIVVGPSTKDMLVLPLDGDPVWHTVRTANPPEYVEFRSAQLDSAGNRILFIGFRIEGTAFTQSYFEVWALSLDDPPTWSYLEDGHTGPTGRSFYSTTWDPVRRRLIVFGGTETIGHLIPTTYYRNVAFTFDGATWDTLRTEGTPPHGRAKNTAVYDAARDRILVFGGEQEDNSPTTVWGWSSTRRGSSRCREPRPGRSSRLRRRHPRRVRIIRR